MKDHDDTKDSNWVELPTITINEKITQNIKNIKKLIKDIDTSIDVMDTKVSQMANYVDEIQYQLEAVIQKLTNIRDEFECMAAVYKSMAIIILLNLLINTGILIALVLTNK